MGKTIEIDKVGERFVATWHTIAGRTERGFDTRADVEAFAMKKMGKTGMVISTLDMTLAQLANHYARQARARSMMRDADRIDGYDRDNLGESHD